MVAPASEAKHFQAYEPSMWRDRAEGGYAGLGWVNSTALLDFIVTLADLSGDEVVMDVASGTGAVPRTLAEHVKVVHASDISPHMLKDAKNMPANVTITQAEANHLPYPSNSADLVTARMVYHHLPDIGKALSEALRVVKPEGTVMVIEYVVPSDVAMPFEREVFDIKEAGRHLWTGPEMAALLDAEAKAQGVNVETTVEYGLLPQYSVRDWMTKSGLSNQEQQQIVDLYLNAPSAIVEEMNITYVTDPETGLTDALVDRPFAYVMLKKVA